MEVVIKLDYVTCAGLCGNAFIFLPAANLTIRPYLAVYTHGYTSHKGSILNWGQRMAELGIASLIFDLPGHYLGSFSGQDVMFKEFVEHGHKLFLSALNKLEEYFVQTYPLEEEMVRRRQYTLILGGHSLGALLSLKAMPLAELESLNKINFSVGLGLNRSTNKTHHLFETDFYQKTLDIRRQLVAPELSPENIFPWIKDEKEHITVSNQNIFLITGLDDVVVPQGNVEKLKNILEKNHNKVTAIFPKRLPHHMPELAASHIVSLVRDNIQRNSI